MKQNFDSIYEIEFDYDNESVQNAFYNKAVSHLKGCGIEYGFTLTVNLKAAMIALEYGKDSKYFKYCRDLTCHNEDLINELMENINTKNLSVIESYMFGVFVGRRYFVNGRTFED